MSLQARVHTEKMKDGSTKVTVLDPQSGRVVSQHRTRGDTDVKAIKQILDSRGYRSDVIERG